MSALRIACVLIAVSTVGTALARQGSSQRPIPGFQSATELVQVDVSALDGHRVPVKGLTADDFDVFEDGHRRDIAAFAAVELPPRVTSTGDAAWVRDVPSDVTTNQTGAAGGRIVVILMDRTIPLGTPTVTARKIATAAVNALGPGDVGALISTSGAVPQNLTSDRARLLAAVNQARDWSTDVSGDAKEIEAAIGLDPVLFSKLTDGRCLCGLCVLETITNVATALEDMARQRKSLLFIGSDITFQAAPQISANGSGRAEIGCGQRLKDAREKMRAALNRSGVIVHSIDPSGLEYVPPNRREQLLQRLGNLEVLPAWTGGRVVANTNAPEENVPEIIRESESYYVIGYRPAEPQMPGQRRNIDVKVRRPGIKISARREYVVPAVSPLTPGDETRGELGAAMRSTLPVADSPLAMTASSFGVYGTSTNAVAVAVDVSTFAAQAAAAGNGRPPLTIAVAAYDVHGRPVGAADVIAVPEAPMRDGRRLETIARLDLPPGDHELRAAVVADGTGRTASVFTHISAPSYALNPLSLSQIVMAAAPDTDTLQRQRLVGLLPIVPTTNREFSRTAPVSAFLQVYQGLSRTDTLQTVRLIASVIDRAGAARVRETLVVTPPAFGDRRTDDFRLTIPVSRLAPGEYLLTIEATAGTRQAGRAIRFVVR